MRVLVTGCGGFLGSEVVRQLISRGDEVVGFGRREYPDLVARGMTARCGDIRRFEDVDDACKGVDAVIHTAAIAGVWGPYRPYYETNTLGSEHVIAACRRQAIPTLVFSSSPSVTFGGQDQSGVDESEPYPSRYLCHYPRTKAQAEKAVLAAHAPGKLATCALRPHLIWSEDDPHLFRRVIDRARAGRLMRVGDGRNLIDTIHVRNAAYGHLLAMDRLMEGNPQAGGRAYFLSQGEPIACWDWICQILQMAGIDPPQRAISFRMAYGLGWSLEMAFHAARRRDEPPMTRFVAAQLAKDHYFDLGAARERLGYEPIVSTAEGLAEVARSWAIGGT